MISIIIVIVILGIIIILTIRKLFRSQTEAKNEDEIDDNDMQRNDDEYEKIDENYEDLKHNNENYEYADVMIQNDYLKIYDEKRVSYRKSTAIYPETKESDGVYVNPDKNVDK